MRLLLFILYLLSFIFLELSVAGHVALAENQTPDALDRPINYGTDITRPIRRYDLRYQYRDFDGDYDAHIITHRLDTVYQITDSGWKFATRTDIPLIYSDIPGVGNARGDIRKGLGDSLLQGLFITPPIKERMNLGLGLQVVLPTATKPNLGSELYQLTPIAGIRVNLPEISKGSYTILGGRYFTTIGEKNHDRRQRHEVQFIPNIHVALQDQWFVNFWAKDGVLVNLEQSPRADKGDIFLPFTTMIGKKVTDNIVMSVEASAPLIHQYKPYESFVEFRIGYFF